MSGIPQWVVALVDELVGWHSVLDERSNPLGYPSSSPEARLLKSPGRAEGVSGSRVPVRDTPRRLALAGRAMQSMPRAMRLALLYRHTTGLEAYIAETGRTKSQYYQLGDQGYWYLTGMLQGMRAKE